MTAGTRPTLRALAALSLLAGLMLAWPARHRVLVTYAPLSLATDGFGVSGSWGLRREPGKAVDELLDTAERPLLTGNARPMDLRWTGFLRVPQAGRWALGLYTDRPASLWLGPYAIVRHPGDATPRLVARSVELEDGFFPLEVRANAGPALLRATLVWMPPGGRLAVVPPSALAMRESAGSRGSAGQVSLVPVAPLATRALELPVVHPLQISNPVLFRWDHAALGVPAFPPLYTMTCTGRVEGGPDPVVEVSASGAFSGSIGGMPVQEAPPAAPRAVRLSGPGPWDLALTVLAEGGEHERLAIVPSAGSRITAPDAPWSPSGRDTASGSRSPSWTGRR